MRKYKIIYADPPWRYGSKGVRGGVLGKLDYPTMSTPEICALPVKEIADDNCALFMWVTGSFIPDALRIGEAWGFKFVRLDKTWIKVLSSGGHHGVPGPWGMTDCEHLFLFVRGSMCRHQVERNQRTSQVVEYPGRHSQKPHFFREQIERRFPSDFRRLEMFARCAPQGWDVFGNEAPNSIEIGVRND